MIKKLHEAMDRRIETETISFRKIFLVQIAVFFVIYGIMLVPRFATDSYSVFFETVGSLRTYLSLGRPCSLLFYKILLTLGINRVTVSPVLVAAFCLSIAWSAAMFLNWLKPCFPSVTRRTALFMELAVAVAFANIYLAEWYHFSADPFALAIFFMTLALYLLFQRKGALRVLFSLVCLCCSLGFYQVALGLFVILGMILILVRHDVLWPKEDNPGAGPLLRELACLLAVGGGAGIVNVLVLCVLGASGLSIDRPPAFAPLDILNSVAQLIRQFDYYYSWGYPSYLTGILKLIFVLAGPVLLFLLADSFDKNSGERYPLPSVAITLLALPAGLLVIFAPHLLSRSVWAPPRTLAPFFALFSLMAVVLAYNYARRGKSVPLAPLVVLLLLVAANVTVIQCIALDQIHVNRQDRQEAEEIVAYIRAYESERKQTVDTISWRSDGTYTWTYPGIKYTFMDMNVRAGSRSWSLTDCIGYYAGRRFRSEKMPDEVWAAEFQGKSWDTFVPEEQIRFSGSTMYLMTY